MQYSYIPLLKKSEKLPYGFIVKSIFLFIMVSFLFFEIRSERDLLINLGKSFKSILAAKSLVLFLVPLFLVPCNWAAEALKWQILSSKIEHQSFTQSFYGVLSGLSLGFITPQSIGEYAGRILQLRNKRRFELIGAVFLGSFMQSMVSLFFGVWGFAILIKNKNFIYGNSSMKEAFIVITISIALILYFLIRRNIISMPLFIARFYQKYFSIISYYSFQDLFKVGTLSLLRYMIFSVQFVIVLIIFDVKLQLHILFAGVSWIFAAKTIIPAFNFLSDIGVREFSALLFFNQYHIDIASIILASLFIWVINILIPTIAGTILVFRMRIFRK